MKINNLKTNHLVNPLGYKLDYIHLSWTVSETEAKSDNWTRVQIAEDADFKKVVFDSGKMEKYGLPYYDADFMPESSTRYFWRVETETDKGEQASEQAWFETALAIKDWRAAWISPKQEEEAMPKLYTTFVAKEGVKSARLYSYGIGLYEAYLGEEKIGDEVLMPGYHSYDLLNQFQTFDVTDMLKVGENTLSFILGEGWYKGRFVFEGGYENIYGERKALTAVLRVVYEDGSVENIYTDDTWKAVQTGILANNIYDGEIIDRTRACAEVEVEVIKAPHKHLKPRLNVPLRKVESHAVKEVLHTPAGSTVLDFGETITGWVEVLGNGAMDFKLLYAEHMQNDEVYRENLRTAKAEFAFKGEAKEEWLRPHFTYYGFRYVIVEGIEDVKAEDFVAYTIMSDIDVTGKIVTSNEKINKLLDNTLRSQKCNFVDVPLDCPQRDERMGWTGDIALYARTGSFHMYTPAFLHNYMENLVLEQKLWDGAVPFFVPKPKIEPHEGINPFLVTAGACTWGDAATIVPWEVYAHYHDKAMLEIHYEAMTAWVNYINGRVKENEVPNLWQNDRQLGDWLALDNGNIYNPVGSTDPGFIASAYYYYSTGLCKLAARALGNKADEKKWTEQEKAIKEAFVKFYYDEKGDLNCVKTQTAYALALNLGLYEADKEVVLVNGLKATLEEYNNHLSTGFAGTGMLMQALADHGMMDIAYTLLLHEDYPSWLREVNLGATTIWERWNSVNDDGTMSDLGMNSLNHYTYGCVAGWMYENVCGFRFNEDGDLYVKMLPDNRIREVEGSYDTIFGQCVVKWSYESDEKLNVTVHVPYQMKLEVELPWGDKQVLEAGTYHFSS